MPGAVGTSPKGVRVSGSWLKKSEYSAVIVVCREFLYDRCDGRRYPLPAARQHDVLNFFEPIGCQSTAHEPGKSVRVLLFPGTTHHGAAAKILQVIRERAECCNDILDISNILLPLCLFALAPRELVQADWGGQESTAFFSGGEIIQ